MILITGASGYVGTNLVKLMTPENTKCFIRRGSNINHLEKFTLTYGDLSDENSIVPALDNVDTIIHLAAITNSKNNHDYYNINTTGTNNLLNACKRKGVKKIIFISSMAVTRNKLDDYGKSKLQAEDLIKKSGLNYTILRPTTIYGNDSDFTKKFIKHVRKVPFFVFLVGDGNVKIQPVFIDDVTKSIQKCIDNQVTNNKVYDILGGTKITLNYFTDFICSRLNLKKIKVHIPIPLALVCITIISLFHKNFSTRKEFIKGLNQDIAGSNIEAQTDLGFKFKKLSQTFTV